MEPLIYTPTYELFFVLEPLRACFDEMQRFAHNLDRGDAPALLGTDVYYRDDTDVSLLAVRFDERALSYRELSWILELAAGMGVPVLDPSRLSDDDRRQFYRSYLSSYDFRLEDFGSASDALRELGIRVGLIRGRASTHTEAPKRLPTEPPLPGRRRLGSDSGVTRRRLGSEPPAPAVPSGRYALGKLSLVEHTETLGGERAKTVPLPRDRPRGKTRAPKRPSTREITRAESPRARTEKGVGERRKPASRQMSTEVPVMAPGLATDKDSIAVRVLRCGQWTTARLGALSNKGAYIVTGGLPHHGELIQMALGYGDIGAMVVGRVSHVTTVEDAAETGQSGFAVKFERKDEPNRTHLISLLRRARKNGVRLKPAPPRAAVRFPVHWPVRVGTTRGGFEAAALDVSTGGLFVATPKRLGDDLVFRLPLDNSQRAVHGRARVVRIVDNVMARERGLSSGYGLRILELSGSDRKRYRAFLRRVRVRTEKRVLVGASPERVRALTRELSCAGYTVTGGSDAQSLINLVEKTTRPPDVVIVDSSLAAFGLSIDWVQQLFVGKRIPCVNASEERAQRTRHEVDRVLSIAA